MFNLAVGGYDPDNFEVIVAGIVTAIDRAHDNLGEGVIKIASGPLQDANWNRSPQAYAGNPPTSAPPTRPSTSATPTPA
jgi:neutral ceramidase